MLQLNQLVSDANIVFQNQRIISAGNINLNNEKLFLLLLIFPSIGNSQVKSFNDLKQINSAQQFKRVVLENGYEKNPRNDNVEIFLSYGIGLKKRNNGYYGASYWGEYFIGDDNLFIMSAKRALHLNH